MNISKVLKSLEGKTIAKADLLLQDEKKEYLNLTFMDNTSTIIEPDMQDINELKITNN